ncbi:MAG: hypothetical protein JO057_24685 [Chloroflexi bacterium]|nr:hypothetical protein [Chloroflexota bacterium]
MREIYDAEIGTDYVPTNADDLKRVLQQLNRPQEERWATASYQGNAYDLAQYAQMFGAPNNWQRDQSGKLVKDYETEAYKSAVGYVRDLAAANLFHPNSNTYNIVSARTDFVARKFVVHLEGWNPFQDFARQGWQLNPHTTFGAIYPFAADGGTPIYYLGPGFIGATASTTPWTTTGILSPRRRRPPPVKYRGATLPCTRR